MTPIPQFLTRWAILSVLCLLPCFARQEYQVGVGIADITGPASDVNFMGYAKTGQTAAGIHVRLFARAFIVADDRGKRVVIVSCDVGMISQIVKIEVVNRLQQNQKYAGIYKHENVLLSATHTHSGPGGFLQYVLYAIPCAGFIPQSFEAIVSGILRSIDRAHDMAQQTRGSIFFTQGQLEDANINRSPTAYQANTEQEKSKYSGNTDKVIDVLKFVDSSNRPLGAIIWFPVHCTSMNNTNQLISGDNKGYASQLFEAVMNPPGSLPGKGPFVAAFPNPNPGDVSPNTRGPHCMDTGASCDNAGSTCNGFVEMCVGNGPGSDMFQSTAIIGQKQFSMGKQLFDSANTRVSGPVDFAHQFIDMSKQSVEYDGAMRQTCKPAMGHSFAAGTTDGPGDFDFKQSTTKNNQNPLWNVVRDVLRPPSPEQRACQDPKPILLDTGEMHVPYEWQPSIVDVQILRIGSVLNAALPGEFTTMSGRRVREAIQASAGQGFQVMLSGLANTYSSYIVTPEEYRVQRYEGASTIFGPYTLPAYVSQYVRLARAVAGGQELPPTGLQPPNLMHKQFMFQTPVIFDSPAFGRKFGDLLYDVRPQYSRGWTVYVSFVAANLRNDLRQESTFLTVESRSGGQWTVVATDANWETRLYWRRTSTVVGMSEVTITWDIPQNQASGSYRIRFFGTSKDLNKQMIDFTGTSSEFQVV